MGGGRKGWPYRRLLPPTDTQHYGTFPRASREGRTGTWPYQKSDQTRTRIRVLCQEEVIGLQSSAQAEGPSTSCIQDWGTRKTGKDRKVKERKERGKGREVNKVSCSLLVGALWPVVHIKRRPCGRNWDPFAPGLLHADIGQRAPTGKERETLLTSLPFPLSFLSLTLPILPRFSSPLVLDAGIWSKGLSLS